MASEFFELGELVSSDMSIPSRVQEYVNALNQYPFARFSVLRKLNDTFIIEAIFDVEKPQVAPVPILLQECIAIMLIEDANTIPEALALRKDFPQTPHQNLTLSDTPKILCLFEQNRQDVKTWLTPGLLLRRISDWLKRAAIEELHREDQPLEPLLLTQNILLYDQSLLSTNDDEAVWMVEPLSVTPLILRAFANSKDPRMQMGDFEYVVTPVVAPAWHARLIEHRPRSFQDLCQLFEILNLNLIDIVGRFLKRSKKLTDWQEAKLILLLALPKSRIPQGETENTEIWSFLVENKIPDLGEKLGIYGRIDGRIVPLLDVVEPFDLEKVDVIPLKPIPRLSRASAQQISGIAANNPNIVCVGAGALGSQVVVNLARQGFGTWTIIDDDNLLPHNLVRHSLSSAFEGRNKAEALAFEVRMLLNSETAAYAVSNNLHEYQGTAFQNCDLALDLSASHSVLHQLVQIPGSKNRVAAFMGPKGQYFALLAEGTAQQLRLDDLSAQLAVAITMDARLTAFFEESEDGIMYAGSCRDLTSEMAQDVVALYAAVTSQWIKRHIYDAPANVHVWKYLNDSLSLEHYEIELTPITSTILNDWDIRVSHRALNLMQQYRRDRLPNETGGVLLGMINVYNRVMYIVDILPSPKDSLEWPTMYIRGFQDLQVQIEEKSRLSGGDLRYLGEWHTHPDNHSSEPSSLDLDAHRFIMEHMAAEGLPGLVLIQGVDPTPFILIDSAS